MSFELRTQIQKNTEMYKGGREDILIFLMRVNSDKDEDWFNCAMPLSMFKDKQSAWLTLKPTIITLLNGCYPEDANVRLT